MKRILCFGDSNTWGYVPRTGDRYPPGIRWPGALQDLLGGDFEVLEEGLNGRTTAFDYKARLGKNGRDYLRPCMDSHFPLHVVILALGTNDAKVEFGLAPEAIAAGLEELIRIARGKTLERPSPDAKLIVAAPPLVLEGRLDSDELAGAEAKTRRLPALYRALAERYGAAFVDLSAEVRPSPLDGCHFDDDGHRLVAKAFHREILWLRP